MLQFLIDLFWILVWGVLSLIDLVFAIFFPNGRVHKLTSEIYHKHVKDFFTGSKMSRTSYSFAHGFFVFVVFCVAFIASIYFFPPTDKDVANKFIELGVTSETGGKLQSFDMNLSQPWEIDGKINLDSLKRDFSFTFYADRTITNTVDFAVTVRSNFDAAFKPDTSNVLSMNIDTLGNKNTKFKVAIANKDSILHPLYSIKSDASIFDDGVHPYVNFYLSFEKPFSCLPQDSQGNLINNKTKLCVFLNSTVDVNDMGNMPYDIISIKPEPETNSPYMIEYFSPAKVKEVLEKGIYISVVNRDLKAEKDRKVVLFSTLFAAAVSFILTVLVVLLTKWRNLNQRTGRKNPYD